MYVSFKSWKDLLPIQHYVSGVIAFLLIEMAFNYGFYANYNETGNPSNHLLAFVTILNAARNAISFFMLLIVSLGYGVVRPSLGIVMNRCLYLAIAHFFTGLLYGYGSLWYYNVK
jgi:hypothetical protein